MKYYPINFLQDKLCIIILICFKINSIFSLQEAPKSISLDFIRDTPSLPSNFSPTYNATDFLNDFFFQELLVEMKLGKPQQTFHSVLNQKVYSFQITNVLSSLNLHNIQKYKTYSILSSSSFSTNDKPSPLANNESLLSGNETFEIETNNYNSTTTTKKNLVLELLIQTNVTYLETSQEKEKGLSNKYMGLLGLSIPTMGYSTSTNFYEGLKKKKEINKYIYSLIFDKQNKNKGKLIIGEELYNYNPKKYLESEYSKVYYETGQNFYVHKICTNNVSSINNDKIELSQYTYGYLFIDYGVIVGTLDYQRLIESIFFNKLIESGICQKDQASVNRLNIRNKFIIYSCDAKKFESHYKKFPSISFVSNKLEYTFELTNKDLFVKVNQRYYFLIIFQSFKVFTEGEAWRFGSPFLNKYTLSLDLDAKMIGVYKKIIENEGSNNNNSSNGFWKIFLGFVWKGAIIVALVGVAFYIGMRINQQRKIRANELKDENYDYSPEENALIN